MKRAPALISAVAMIIGLVLGSPAHSNERMTDPKATPDPNTYTVHEFTFSGLSLFDGAKYVAGWNKVQIAVPKLVKCSDFAGYSNCIAYLRSSVETPFSSGPIGTYQPPVYYSYSVIGPDSRVITTSSLFPTVVQGGVVGSVWTNETVYFSAAQSGTVFLRVSKKGTGPDVADIPIQVSVRTQAEIDAENKAREAAEKARQDEADRKERERISRILATKLTITCKSGGKTKKVAGDPPVCPKGYSNSMQNQPAFKAYSQCKLYKKQYGYSRAYLQDGGKTLQLDGYGLGWSSIDLTDRDWSCVVRTLKIPGSVQNKIGQTRALDGMVSAKFAGIEAFWTYHPDNGLDITFSK